MVIPAHPPDPAATFPLCAPAALQECAERLARTVEQLAGVIPDHPFIARTQGVSHRTSVTQLTPSDRN